MSEPGPGQDWLRGSGESQATRQGVPAAILSDLLHRALVGTDASRTATAAPDESFGWTRFPRIFH